eukprot:2126839-Alexandrium_andersonii.AAC.1
MRASCSILGCCTDAVALFVGADFETEHRLRRSKVELRGSSNGVSIGARNYRGAAVCMAFRADAES